MKKKHIAWHKAGLPFQYINSLAGKDGSQQHSTLHAFAIDIENDTKSTL